VAYGKATPIRFIAMTIEGAQRQIYFQCNPQRRCDWTPVRLKTKSGGLHRRPLPD